MVCGEGWANHFSVHTRKESTSLSAGHTLRNKYSTIMHKVIDYTPTIQWLPQHLRPSSAFYAQFTRPHSTTRPNAVWTTYSSPQSGSDEHCMQCRAQWRQQDCCKEHAVSSVWFFLFVFGVGWDSGIAKWDCFLAFFGRFDCLISNWGGFLKAKPPPKRSRFAKNHYINIHQSANRNSEDKSS